MNLIIPKLFKRLTDTISIRIFLHFQMEQRALKIVNNSLNTNIYSCLETSGGQSLNLHLNVVHFVNTSVN
jgi:hypothetical protein